MSSGRICGASYFTCKRLAGVDRKGGLAMVPAFDRNDRRNHVPANLIFVFGVTLMLATLLSERAARTVLSASVLFLGVGFLLGDTGLGWTALRARDPVSAEFAELALFLILLVDGSQLSLGELRRAWHLPGRALLLGMPLTIGLIALAGHVLMGMTWIEAFVVGAILSPTDPVFVAAILERESVPLRLRRLLGVESGLNDGFALPAVLVLLAIAGHRDAHVARIVIETAAGPVFGVLVPALFLWLEARGPFAASPSYRPLVGVAIGAVLYGLGKWLHGNELLAAFTGGVTLATLRPEFAQATRQVGAPLAEVLKLATVLIFGVTLSNELPNPGWLGIAFASAALLAARPLALVLALRRNQLSRREWLAAAWFGPKGFASLLYALLLLHAGLPRGDWLFGILAVVIAMSIVAHSSTDVIVARVFCQDAAGGESRPSGTDGEAAPASESSAAGS